MRNLVPELASGEWAGRTCSGDSTMSQFLSSLPLWLSTLLVIVLPTLVAMAGPVFIRRKFGLERLAANNEIAGFQFATVGVIYAVLIAFATIVVWQRFNDAEAAVLQEAGAAVTIYRLAAGPEPEIAATRDALNKYLKLVVDKDWRQMAVGEESEEANSALNALYATATRISKKGLLSGAITEEIFDQLDSITQARRVRLHLAAGIVPDILWAVLFAGAMLTIGFTFLFGAESLSAQVVMTGILSVMVLMGLLVIVSVDHPFTGPVHVDTEPLDNALADFSRRS
jgi:hypothetical protein